MQGYADPMKDAILDYWRAMASRARRGESLGSLPGRLQEQRPMPGSGIGRVDRGSAGVSAGVNADKQFERQVALENVKAGHAEEARRTLSSGAGGGSWSTIPDDPRSGLFHTGTGEVKYPGQSETESLLKKRRQYQDHWSNY